MKPSIASRLLQRVRVALFALAVLCIPGASFAAVYVSVAIAPPPIPVYTQPICPGPGYIWQPGYWAYGPTGWYWVPGVWVLAPFIGALWTPGYWGWSNGYYVWHAGYWGATVGFYGGVNYGFGYTGYGYSGGYWRGNAFYYNRAVNRVDTRIVHTTYRGAVNPATTSRVSYNGGPGGTTARAGAFNRRAGAQRSAPMRNAQTAGVRAQAAPARHSLPPVVARAQAPSSPRPAPARPGGGHAPPQPRIFAEATHAQAQARVAPHGHPQGGRGAPRQEAGAEGRHHG